MTSCHKASATICLSPLPIASSAIKSFPVVGNTKVTIIESDLQHIISLSKGNPIVCVYALYEDYVKHIEKVSTAHPDTVFCIFSQYKGPATSDNVVLFDINVSKFAACLKLSKVLITTAGIEAVCEAINSHKTVIVIPTTGHYEQFENAKLFSRLEGITHVDSFTNTTSISNALQSYLNDTYNVMDYNSQCNDVTNYINDFDTDELMSILS
jgi:uncharacterized protein (TIGR00661 family)